MSLILISLYYYVCDCYDSQLRYQVQRFSPNKLEGEITDEELLTIYLYCVGYQEKTNLKSMHTYIQDHWLSYFPKLPAYQTFVGRINRMSDLFEPLINQLIHDLRQASAEQYDMDAAFLLLDSMPIITCSGKREGKVAPDLTGKSFCATKNLWYYGVKFHLLSQKQPARLPLPYACGITPAYVHDLKASRWVLSALKDKVIFADKAYADQILENQLLISQNVELITPIKTPKATPKVIEQREKAYNKAFSSAVSSIKQPIESFFAWLHEKTKIQFASKVRSHIGLRVHVFGKFAAALCLLLHFNP